MAEAIVSTILEQLTTTVIENARAEWELVTGVDKEVQRLECNFKAIQLELEDAEIKQFMGDDKRVKPWLDRFKEVSYDMEDVLDEWKTALYKLQDRTLETTTTTLSCSALHKVCPFLSWFCFGSKVVRHRHDIATRIKEINEELDQIAKDKDRLELIKRETNQPNKRSDKSTSFVDVSQLHGRDEVKEDIIRRLLCARREEGKINNIPTITMVGMGGIGKTALAQLIYNDERIQSHFDKKAWACVSDPFDQCQIARAILEDLDPNVSLHNTTSLQTLLRKIREQIKEKKFFLVLDDVWTDHGQDWEPLIAVFHNGMSGSRILVTTRKESVAEQMESSENVFNLQLLTEEICCLILMQKAFAGRRNKQIEYENLKGIGREIAKKCKGLPLVAKTLGGLLQGKVRREEWEDILHSKIWELNLAEEYIFKPLLLSYFDLPSAIRQCLLYCAIFPKDWRIFRSELIHRWMSHGYLNSGDNSKIESTGEYYFKCLATRSFFQDFEQDDAGNVSSFIMHDIVHDFVQFLTKSEFIAQEKINSAENLGLDLSTKNARHLVLIIEEGSHCPSLIHGAEKLRSLVIIFVTHSDIDVEVLGNLLSQSKSVRLLDLTLTLSSIDKLKEIPGEIGRLIHLRYLNLRNNFEIRELPEAFCELLNLQVLDVQWCQNLKKLPDGIGKLINLRHFYTRGCRSLTYYPKGMGKLTSLITLSDVIVRADRDDAKEFSIGDLENLDMLRKDLHVVLVGDVIDRDEAKRAKLPNKKHLKGMYIRRIDGALRMDDVLDALDPPSNIHVVFGDMRPKSFWEKLSLSVLVSKAAFQFLDAVMVRPS